MISVRVGGLYKYQSKMFAALSIWRHKCKWRKATKERRARSYIYYELAGTIKDSEIFVVLSINSLGEPLVLTSGEKIGLIYVQHMRMKEISATEIPVKV